MKQIFPYVVGTAIGVLAACSGGGTISKASDTKPQNGSPVAEANPGRVLFESKCATCHGADGTSGIGGAANLQTSWLDSAATVNLMQQGRGGMPSFADQLTSAEMGQISQYINQLKK